MGRLTDEQIAVVKNDFEEKGWTAYRIWQEHPRFGWPECTRNLEPIRKAIKQFLLRLREVENKDGGSIKTVFG